MKAYLPQFRIEKLLLDSAHDAYAVYEYCRREKITPFIDLNPGHTGHFTYKDDFTIGGMVSRSAGWAYVCTKMDMRLPNTGRNTGVQKPTEKGAASVNIPVHRRNALSQSHIFTDDNPRLFNIPPRDSKAWKKEYARRTSVERSNKREKEDYKLEDGRHRSTKMWYCRLYGIMMLQHLDAWEMPSVEAFQKSLLGLAA